jgi:hypothetical protein
MKGRYGDAVCARWRESFENFLADMGERPDGTLLTRLNRDADYALSNVSWLPPGTKTEETSARRKRHHGHAPKHGHSPTYASWQAMVQRCTNPNNDNWERYGGRGITVCARWLDFRNFLADAGERMAGTTLDRIDNDGNYEPGNVRWAPPKVQSANKPVVGSRACVEGCTCGRHRPYMRTAETRARLSEAKMGHEVSVAARAKMSAARQGKPGKRCAEGCTCGRHGASRRRDT